MKPPILSYVVFLAVVLFTINTQLITGAEGPVYDVRGKRVLNDSPYYIGPVIWAKGRGIKLTDTINNKKVCPSYVVQDPAEVNKGGTFLFTMLTFEIEKPRKHLLTERALGIGSGLPKAPCYVSTFWQIADLEAKAPSNSIMIGGKFEDDYSCFQVVDYPKPTSPEVHSYMLL
ncbi:chymotrypsin inhibitor 3-like [Bidens hawaiensis]|uniref:chymotrypsin inhibitor 3-like n=1 Tax=Bidens hawaiensis TaxID=980011 RepID=UPI004049071B